MNEKDNNLLKDSQYIIEQIKLPVEYEIKEVKTTKDKITIIIGKIEKYINI